MNERSNMRNRRTFDYTIADIALLSAAMHSAVGTAMVYFERGKKSKKRMAQFAKMFDDICPVPMGVRGEEYAWFESFLEAEECAGYLLRLERGRDRWSGPNSVRLAFIVDGRRYQLTDDLEYDREVTTIPDKYVKMFDETMEMVREVVPSDAQELVAATIYVSIPEVPRNTYPSFDVTKLKFLNTMIAKQLKAAERDDLKIFVDESEFVRSGELDLYKVNVYVRPSDVDFVQAFFSEPAAVVPAPQI